MDLTNRTDISELLKKYEVFAKKSFGQNFLVSRPVLEKIVDTAKLTKEDIVIEVGPGLGVLSVELAQKAAKVISLELDRNVLPILEETLKDFSNIEILNQDALKYSPTETNYKIVANIPYNITSHLINHYLQTENPPTSLTLLVQKEVAEKLCTLEPDMSVLSLEVALFGTAKFIKKVAAGSFLPAPKVDSAIIYIELYKRTDPRFIPKDKALAILKAAKTCFSQRRKKLSNTLPEEYQENCPIDLTRRPETLSVKEWAELIH